MEAEQDRKMLEAFHNLKPETQNMVERYIYFLLERETEDHKKQFRVINQRKEGE